jgi:hypothetical protein
MMVVQTHLMRKTEYGEVHCKCWLNVKPNVKVGSVVKLEDSDEWFTVVSQGHVMEQSEINTKWGLNLPKSQRLER